MMSPDDRRQFELVRLYLYYWWRYWHADVYDDDGDTRFDDDACYLVGLGSVHDGLRRYCRLRFRPTQLTLVVRSILDQPCI